MIFVMNALTLITASSKLSTRTNFLMGSHFLAKKTASPQLNYKTISLLMGQNLNPVRLVARGVRMD